jgi:hypothetical protein
MGYCKSGGWSILNKRIQHNDNYVELIKKVEVLYFKTSRLFFVF